jgi:hypothetical protein
MKKGLAVLLSLLVVVMIGLLVARAQLPVEKDSKEVDPTVMEMSEEAVTAAETPVDVIDSAEQKNVNPEAAMDEQYEAAAALFAAGEYEQAMDAFTALGGYKDSSERIEACKGALLDKQYSSAVSLYTDGKYEEAMAAFAALEGYRDSGEQVENCRLAALDAQYNTALALYADRKFAEAQAAFEALGDYKDAFIRARALSSIQQTIAAGFLHTIAVRNDGSVVAVGNNHRRQMDVSDWTGIISVATGWEHSLGLRSDGTVVAVGENFFGVCDVSDWTDIVAISAGNAHTVGLRSDGTVVATGANATDMAYDGRCQVSEWTDILQPGGHKTIANAR